MSKPKEYRIKEYKVWLGLQTKMYYGAASVQFPNAAPVQIRTNGHHTFNAASEKLLQLVNDVTGTHHTQKNAQKS